MKEKEKSISKVVSDCGFKDNELVTKASLEKVFYKLGLTMKREDIEFIMDLVKERA